MEPNAMQVSIRKQVSRARRRLWVELFLHRLVRCWFVTFLAAAVAVAVPKLIAIQGLPAEWTTWWLGGAVAAGSLKDSAIVLGEPVPLAPRSKIAPIIRTRKACDVRSSSRATAYDCKLLRLR